VTWLRPVPENIPAELRALPWVLWRGEARGQGKPTKVPYRVLNPHRKASSTDPATWSTFDAAVGALDYADGIGVVLTGGVITCVDLDAVIDERGQVDERAQALVNNLDSWTEISPSGTGLHIFVRGIVPKDLKGKQIEVYSTGRYIAVTGHRWPRTPDVLTNQQWYLDHLAQLASEDERPRRAYTGPSVPAPDDLAGELLAKLQAWGVPYTRLKSWSDGYLVELVACPWADEHTTGAGGAAVIIRASGAYDFTCRHAHCGGRDWRDFRATMEGRA
jgi:hypothetical protein